MLFNCQNNWNTDIMQYFISEFNVLPSRIDLNAIYYLTNNLIFYIYFHISQSEKVIKSVEKFIAFNNGDCIYFLKPDGEREFIDESDLEVFQVRYNDTFIYITKENIQKLKVFLLQNKYLILMNIYNQQLDIFQMVIQLKIKDKKYLGIINPNSIELVLIEKLPENFATGMTYIPTSFLYQKYLDNGEIEYIVYWADLHNFCINCQNKNIAKQLSLEKPHNQLLTNIPKNSFNSLFFYYLVIFRVNKKNIITKIYNQFKICETD